MNRKHLRLVILALIVTGCAAIAPGNDPVVVNAERVTAAAADTFDTAFQLEYANHAILKQSSPQVITYVNYVRVNSPKWLASARALTNTYKDNRNAQNKANLQTALSVLTTATSQLNTYFPQIKTS